MKRIFFEKAYQPFLATALITLGIALFFKGVYPGSVFDVSVYDIDFNIATSRVWFLFTGYLLFLSIIYFVISRNRLKTKKWLVISHYVFIVSFLVFFMVFSSFSSPGVKKLTADIPIVSLITLYGTIFLLDVIFFALGLIFLLINLFSLSRNKAK